MIIISHHRSEKLAERKLAELLRKYPSVEFLDRRNATGKFSANGHTFRWRVPDDEKEEFIVHFDYGQKSKKKGDQRIQFQVHVFGPKGATFDDAINAIRTRNQGDPWPKGWSKRAIYWTKPRDKGKRRTDPLPPSLRQSALGVGSVSFTDRKNRGNK